MCYRGWPRDLGVAECLQYLATEDSHPGREEMCGTGCFGLIERASPESVPPAATIYNKH